MTNLWPLRVTFFRQTCKDLRTLSKSYLVPFYILASSDMEKGVTKQYYTLWSCLSSSISQRTSPVPLIVSMYLIVSAAFIYYSHLHLKTTRCKRYELTKLIILLLPISMWMYKYFVISIERYCISYVPASIVGCERYSAACMYLQFATLHVYFLHSVLIQEIVHKSN